MEFQDDGKRIMAKTSKKRNEKKTKSRGYKNELLCQVTFYFLLSFILNALSMLYNNNFSQEFSFIQFFFYFRKNHLTQLEHFLFDNSLSLRHHFFFHDP